MEKVTIIITETAFEDLEEIEEYIALDSPRIAKRFIEKIFIEIQNLITHPNVGRIVPEFNEEDLRELIYKKYRIIYLLSGEKEIRVIRIIHGSRLLDLG